MSGITQRTPVKTSPEKPTNKSPQNVTVESGPPKQNVRKSVGEWEAGMGERRRAGSPVSKVVKEQAQKDKQTSVASRRASTDTGSQPAKVKITQINRVAEAKACLTKAKLHLNNSRNLKTEIKSELIAQIDRLYQLVKELEEERRQGLTLTTEKAKGSKEGHKSEDTTTRDLETQSLKKVIEEHSRNLVENGEKMDRLKEALLTTQNQLGKASYASIVAGQPTNKIPIPTALHSIVVTAENEQESGEDVMNLIRKTVNAKEGGLQVEKIRRAKDRKVIVGCRTEEERTKIKERLKKAPELKVEDIRNKDPLIVLKFVMLYNTNEEIQQALYNQNSNIFGDLQESQKKIEILFRKRTRNPHVGHIVLRVATEAWKRMIEAGTVHVDLQRVKVEDQSPLIQCTLCLGYGHSRRLCTETIAKCSHCGGPHMRAECADWLSGTAPTCSNCVHAKLSKIDHNAFSTECTIRKRWDAIARAAIAYC